MASLVCFQLDFYGGLNELDASIGRVLDALDSTGYRNNTVRIVYECTVQSVLRTLSYVVVVPGA